MTVQLPAHLSDAINNLADLARELAEEVRNDRRDRRRATRWLLGLSTVAVLLLVGLGVLGVQTAQLATRIEDCTTAGGRCYEDGRSRTRDAVGQIIDGGTRAVVFTHLCMRDHPEARDAQIEACVAERMKRPPAAAPAPTPHPTHGPAAPRRPSSSPPATPAIAETGDAGSPEPAP